jgi:GT2 family glycosyltransferase
MMLALREIEDLLTVLRNPANLGFTGVLNVGMHHAVALGADYVWLVNSDATGAPHTLTELVATAESDPSVGLVGPAIHDPVMRETLLVYLEVCNPHYSFALTTDSRKEAESWLAYRANEVFLYGTALLARRAPIEAIGGLDDRFFAYIEDIDYCLRCRQADFKIVPCFDAIVYHRFEDPENQLHLAPAHLHYLVTRNYLLLWRKQSPRLLGQKAALWFSHSRLRQLERLIGLPEQQEALLAGLRDGVSGPYFAARRAPRWFRSTLGRHPRLVITCSTDGGRGVPQFRRRAKNLHRGAGSTGHRNARTCFTARRRQSAPLLSPRCRSPIANVSKSTTTARPEKRQDYLAERGPLGRNRSPSDQTLKRIDHMSGREEGLAWSARKRNTQAVCCCSRRSTATPLTLGGLRSR